jgi:hypothetical protein
MSGQPERVALVWTGTGHSSSRTSTSQNERILSTVVYEGASFETRIRRDHYASVQDYLLR